jgi:uncharacterized protein CbrC (UPF0167 family)
MKTINSLEEANMILGFFAVIVSFIVAYKIGKHAGTTYTEEDEWRKNVNHEPTLFSLQHEIWENTHSNWLAFIDSLETEDVKLIRQEKDNLKQEIDKSFNEKVDQLKRLGIIS